MASTAEQDPQAQQDPAAKQGFAERWRRELVVHGRAEFTADEQALLDTDGGFLVYIDADDLVHACPTSSRPGGDLRVLGVFADAGNPRVAGFLKMPTVDTHPDVWVLKPNVGAPPPPAPAFGAVRARTRTRSRERRCRPGARRKTAARAGPDSEDPEPEPASGDDVERPRGAACLAARARRGRPVNGRPFADERRKPASQRDRRDRQSSSPVHQATAVRRTTVDVCHWASTRHGRPARRRTTGNKAGRPRAGCRTPPPPPSPRAFWTAAGPVARRRGGAEPGSPALGRLCGHRLPLPLAGLARLGTPVELGPPQRGDDVGEQPVQAAPAPSAACSRSARRSPGRESPARPNGSRRASPASRCGRRGRWTGASCCRKRRA